MPMNMLKICPCPQNEAAHLTTWYYIISSVMDKQYLLVDPIEVRNILTPTVSHPSVAREAARLAAIHYQRANCRSHSYIALQDKDTISIRQAVTGAAEHNTRKTTRAPPSASSPPCSTAGTASDRNSLIRLARPDILLTCNGTTRSVIKVAIWFNVLAAVTTQEVPRFLEFIRALYSPEASGVYDPSLVSTPELSMMTVMGCENQVVWALAEASALAVWKRRRQATGTLDLVAQGSRPDKYLDLAAASSPLPMYLGAMGQETETQVARELSSHIFHPAARVYVRSIVSGDYPHVPEIREAVDETMGYLARHSQKVYSSVVRSTVFGPFICGTTSTCGAR
ncbi:hypothetical protein MSAN_00344700 [Mycena sanguinolenta]|uniref:Uncharacterized protein n=1 Tax=Mycena sanguinolenta TaxID=230812 RepID=A0A8H6ZE37_9AGAR|nr:hypothetical protein MSAN_00344700 [Mycena sanguinolenta]